MQKPSPGGQISIVVLYAGIGIGGLVHENTSSVSSLDYTLMIYSCISDTSTPTFLQQGGTGEHFVQLTCHDFIAEAQERWHGVGLR